MNGLIYIIAQDRGTTGLYAYNGAELAPIITGNIEDHILDMTGYKRKFPFVHMVGYRGKVILATRDKIFAYGKNGNVNAMSNILTLESGEIKRLEAKGEELRVKYQDQGIRKTLIYRENREQNYKSEREIRLPIQIGSHLLEKEIQDLEISYLLPSKDCKLEVWCGGNKFHFWTFKIKNIQFKDGERCRLAMGDGDYQLIHQKSEGDWHTFCLEGDLPHKTREAKELIRANGERVSYNEMNHLKKI